MSNAPLYRVRLRDGTIIDAADVDWLPRRLRVTTLKYRLELDHESNDSRPVPDGVRIREYPFSAIRHVDLDHEAQR